MALVDIEDNLFSCITLVAGEVTDIPRMLKDVQACMQRRFEIDILLVEDNFNISFNKNADNHVTFVCVHTLESKLYSYLNGFPSFLVISVKITKYAYNFRPRIAV